MKRIACIVVGLLLACAICHSAASEAEITNGLVHVRLYLPDVNTGFYRGTRFDWAGVIGSLQFAGHDYYPQWFDRSDGRVHDFTYEAGEIVAGPCTAIT